MNPSGGKLPIMPPLGRNGVDLYGQTKATGAWVWAGNAAGSSSDEICAPLTAFTTDASSSGRADNSPLDSSVVARFILYLPLWRACSDDLAIGIPAADHAAGGRIVAESGGISAGKPTGYGVYAAYAEDP